MADMKKTEQRRQLTREEREQMKRELKAQLRAYVDALKEQMLAAKEKGENPDLDQAMQRAEKEAERKLMAEAAQGDPMVEQAARTQARAQQAQEARQAPESAPAGHDGVVPKFSAWRPAEVEEKAGGKLEEKAEPDMKGSDVADVAEKDVLHVASTVEEAPQGEKESSSEATGGETTGGETTSGEVRPDESGEQRYIVPEEEAAKSALPREELERLTRDIIAALKTIYDPEIPVDIYELGLIYRIDIADDRTVTIDMTLTAPGCPVAGDMPAWVQKAVSEVEGVKDVKVNLVFDPPWDMSRMSDEARLALNMF